MTVRDRILQQSHLGDDDLLAALAAELYGTGREALPGADAHRRAMRWLERFLDERRDALCLHPAVVAMLSQDGYDQVEEAVVIAEALATAAGAPSEVVLTTVALILARRRLRAICG